VPQKTSPFFQSCIWKARVQTMSAIKESRFQILLFLAGRCFFVLGQTIDGLRGYGDYQQFYMLAGLGRPFLDFWVEFPPVFPYLSRSVYLLAGGRQHPYDYLLFGILTIAQVGGLVLFYRLIRRLYPEPEATRRCWLYTIVLLCLFYGWSYFDSLAVFFLLLGLVWLIEGRDRRAALALAAGALTKFFPVLAVVVAWRYRTPRRASMLTAIIVGVNLLVWGMLFVRSPEFTAASLRSQSSKGSWETIWALIDNNLIVGNFGPLSERYDPQTAYALRGNPAQVSPWITLLACAGLGAWLYFRAQPGKDSLGWQQDGDIARQGTAFLGLTFSLFFIWMPGYSPQWLLYLLPLIIIILPEREAFLFTVILVIAHLLEWPILLSRGYFNGLWLTIPIRTFLFILLVFSFWAALQKSRSMDA
jgi:hypothetical protein